MIKAIETKYNGYTFRSRLEALEKTSQKIDALYRHFIREDW
jgi:hypothetical protein